MLIDDKENRFHLTPAQNFYHPVQNGLSQDFQKCCWLGGEGNQCSR